MLEIPESQTMAKQLQKELRGKTIAGATAAQNPHGFAWYFGEPADYPALLKGKTIQGAKAVAGFVEIEADGAQFLFNDGVNIRYLAPGAPLPAKHQLHVSFEDGSGFVCTIQMYGGILAFPTGAYQNPYYQVAQEKPSPLAAAFNEAYFEGIVAAGGPKLSAKALLATEQRIPGLGNGCLQDILYNARVNPQSKVGKLRDGDVEALFHSVKDTLAEMTAAGGRDTEKDFYGRPGGYQTKLSSKTVAYACRECGGGLVRKAYLGGNVYYCPACQPVLK